MECMTCSNPTYIRRNKDYVCYVCSECRRLWEEAAYEQTLLLQAGKKLERGWKANDQGNVIWYEQEWYDAFLPAHARFNRDRRTVALHDNITVDDIAESVPVELHGIDPKFIHVYLVIKALHEVEHIGAHRIAKRLNTFNITPMPSFGAVRKYLDRARTFCPHADKECV